MALRLMFIVSLLVFSPGCETAKEFWDSLPNFTAERDGKTVVGKECVKDADGKENCTIKLPDKKK